MPTPPTKRSQSITFETVRALALSLPGVEESTLRGSPSLKLGGKLFACPALHRSAEPDTLVVRVGLEQRAALLATEPERYYVTEHYAKHPVVLARLARLNRTALKQLLKLGWQCGGASGRELR